MEISAIYDFFIYSTKFYLKSERSFDKLAYQSRGDPCILIDTYDTDFEKRRSASAKFKFA